MRLALLTNGIFPYVVGGIQKHSYYLAKYLARLGVHVHLYCALPSEVKSNVDEESLFTPQERKRIRMIPVERTRLPYFPGHYIRESYLSSARIFMALQRNQDVDFIYAQGFTGWKAIREKQNGATLPPIGVHFHGLNMFQKSHPGKGRLEQWLFRPFVKINITQADVVFSLGGGLNHLIQSLGVPQNKIVESPNGITEDWFVTDLQARSDPLTFVFVGRYHRLKGVEELHKAIGQLGSKYDYRFHFVGPVLDHLKIKSPQITYWGLVRKEDDVKAIMQQSDVLVCPSYSEGMPTVILEAMASGLAVIATQVGAVDALVSSENGWLIPPGDGRSLAQALIDAITIPGDVLLKKKKRSRSLVEKEFLWDVIARKTAEGIGAVL